MAHFTVFFVGGAYQRLDHWDGDLDTLPGTPADIEVVRLMFDDDGSAMEFWPSADND